MKSCWPQCYLSWCLSLLVCQAAAPPSTRNLKSLKFIATILIICHGQVTRVLLPWQSFKMKDCNKWQQQCCFTSPVSRSKRLCNTLYQLLYLNFFHGIFRTEAAWVVERFDMAMQDHAWHRMILMMCHMPVNGGITDSLGRSRSHTPFQTFPIEYGIGEARTFQSLQWDTITIAIIEKPTILVSNRSPTFNPNTSPVLAQGLCVSLVKAITDSVCRWSVAATGTVAGLGDSCCALMLEAVLQDRGQMLGQDGKSPHEIVSIWEIDRFP